ncbi:MAG: asparagine synthase C-terminal domain-containing protein [Candidatus Binatia bacterium]
MGPHPARALALRRLAATAMRGTGGGALATIGTRLDARGAGEVFDRALPHFDDGALARLAGLAPATRPSAMDYPGEADVPLALWDLHHYLPGDILTKVDRTTMAAHVEGRVPLLDHRVVELAYSLPAATRHGALGAKHLLKRILSRHLPRSLADRPKRGFAVPLKEWLAADLRELVATHLDRSANARMGLFDPAAVDGYLRRLRAGEARVRQQVWLLLACQLWAARWL